MKKIIIFLFIFCCTITTIFKFVNAGYGVGNSITSSNITSALGFTPIGSVTTALGFDVGDYRWIRVALASNAANTPVAFVSNADVGSKSAYLISFIGKVNGATAWTAGAGGMTKVEILDTAGNNLFVGITLANLTGNADFAPGTANVGHGDAYRLRTGTPAGMGMHLVADGTATAGSTIQFTALIKIE